MESQGILLFRHIFAIAPGALLLFSFKDDPDLYNSTGLKNHGKGVMGYVDAALDDFAGYKTDLEKLGKRHFERGIQIPHYEVVGQALIKTLADALEDDFTPELKAHWETVYGMIGEVMQGDQYEK